MLAVHCRSDVTLTGPLAPTTYRSSDWAERGFCPACGTHLFYRLVASNEYVLPAGLFEGERFELKSQIFIDERPAYYAFANDTAKLTGAQVFEQFASARDDARSD